MKNESKTINWKVLIGYILMISTFLSIGLYLTYNYGIIFIPILWLSWFIYSIYLWTKPEFNLHGKILLIIWALITLIIVGILILLIFVGFLIASQGI